MVEDTRILSAAQMQTKECICSDISFTAILPGDHHGREK